MSGHYHVICENGKTINNKDLDAAILEAKQNGNPGTWQWICQYGCGKAHYLLDLEMEKIHKAFPNRYYNSRKIF